MGLVVGFGFFDNRHLQAVQYAAVLPLGQAQADITGLHPHMQRVADCHWRVRDSQALPPRHQLQGQQMVVGVVITDFADDDDPGVITLCQRQV